MGIIINIKMKITIFALTIFALLCFNIKSEPINIKTYAVLNANCTNITVPQNCSNPAPIDNYSISNTTCYNHTNIWMKGSKCTNTTFTYTLCSKVNCTSCANKTTTFPNNKWVYHPETNPPVSDKL